jgi:RNA polymerase sigma-B factor
VPASTRARRKKSQDGPETPDAFATRDDPAADVSAAVFVGESELDVEAEALLPGRISAHQEFDTLFKMWQETGDPRLRDRLILMNRSLVSFIARRFNDRGEMSEDIIQQGLIGLINALDHFDPKRGVLFATFATPTIMGEIRRYFRDRTWSLRVPRRLQELNLSINNRVEVLTQELGRSPTYAEIARALNLQIEEIVEALEMTAAVDPVSIDEEVSFGASGESSTNLGDQIGVTDMDLENADDHAILENALSQLSARERQVLELAYFQEHSQVEIARRMNVSQMFVSRLQRRALSHLRELMGDQEI